MLKRILTMSGMVMLSSGIILLIWQPDALKTKILNTVAKEASRSTSYELSIARVSGNIFTGITLQDMHILSKADHSEVLQAKAIKIGVSWWALWRRKIQVQSLDWIEPTVRVVMNQKGTSSREPFPFTYSIRRLTIENGRLVIVNAALPKSQELLFRDIRMDARVSSGHLVINRLDWQVDQGHGSAQADLSFVPTLSGDLKIQDHDVPLDRLLVVTGDMPSLPRLPYSGEWTLHTASGTTTAAMKGTLAGGAVALDGLYTPTGLERVHLTWQKPGLASVFFHMVHGIGAFQVVASSGDFKVTAQGDTNWSRRSVQGHAALTNFAWQDVTVKQADAQFSVSPHDQHLVLKTKEVQFHRQQNPFDLQSSEWNTRGGAPRWQSTIQLKFRNGSTADVAGVVAQINQSWKLAWQKLEIAFPSAGTWKADQPGTMTRDADGRIEMTDVSLSNGAQSIQIPQAVMNRQTLRLTLTAHEVDPGPWLKLFSPDTSLTSASLNASLHLHGTGRNVIIDGFVNGKAKTLEVHSVGLNAKDMELDARAIDGKIEIKRFTAKTKKGEISVTGGAAWPELDYSLHAHDLVLNTTSLIKARGDLDIHLAGTAEYPVLTGHLAIKEAAYVASAKTGKKKPEASAKSSDSSIWWRSAIDMDTHWARNVWYREGVTNIETQGDLRIQKAKEKPDLLLTGTIRSVRGTYNYFGRDFNIESGEIQFAGTPEINPSLNIEASYRSDPTIIYLDITGSADKPVLKARSNPPLPEQDIISVIVFGQPLNELRSRTGTQTSNQQMMQAAGGVLGSYVTKELRQTGIAELNVDMLNLQATPQGSQLTVGRYLSRRLFISYGQAIRGSAEKSVTADYFLTDKWTLQGASDSTEGNFMDFLFRYPLNRQGAASNTSPLPTSPFRATLDPINPQQPSFNSVR